MTHQPTRLNPSSRSRFAMPSLRPSFFASVLLLALVTNGCERRRTRTDLDYNYQVMQVINEPNLPSELVQFESVFWEPDDTNSLRDLLLKGNLVDGRRVLEIGTGTGLVSLYCLLGMAKQVVATDINPAAVANARYNAAMMDLEMDFDVRQVPPAEPGAFTVIKPDETFDLIISNPPWEDGQVKQPSDHAFYDPQFALMDSILDGLPDHLRLGGRCLLVYGHVPAIKRLLRETEKRGFPAKILDDRQLDDLDVDFLPGMMIEVKVPREKLSRGPSRQPAAESASQ
ncbi:MAG: hypothetical protein CBB71_02140 [Rhodopirellula sp. TMED11]|nr:MAG: hypothetical protein CBB71_02140 [Rhodopirellula sp. TMED11]